MPESIIAPGIISLECHKIPWNKQPVNKTVAIFLDFFFSSNKGPKWEELPVYGD